MQILFYEKPGCINNTKQKKVLAGHGHTVIAHSLLTHPWNTKTLRPFFGDLPIHKWFNMSAPLIKSGVVNPNSFTAEAAIDAMIQNPLLIRRPLLSVGGYKACGFDHDLVTQLINNQEVTDLLTCPNINYNCD